MSKQDLRHIEIILSCFESMGASQEELMHEKKAMIEVPMFISINLDLLGLL